MALSGISGAEPQLLEVALARNLPLVPELIRASAASAKTPEALGRLVSALSAPQLSAADQSKYLTLVAQNVASRRQASACATLIEKASSQSAWRDAILKGQCLTSVILRRKIPNCRAATCLRNVNGLCSTK
jgi:hypothetical protein